MTFMTEPDREPECRGGAVFVKCVGQLSMVPAARTCIEIGVLSRVCHRRNRRGSLFWRKLDLPLVRAELGACGTHPALLPLWQISRVSRRNRATQSMPQQSHHRRAPHPFRSFLPPYADSAATLRFSFFTFVGFPSARGAGDTTGTRSSPSRVIFNLRPATRTCFNP